MGYSLPFYPHNRPKNENFRKWKKHWRYHHFTQVYQKSWSYWQTVPEIWCAMYVIVTLHFGPFFAILPQNLKKKKKKKKHLEISSFYTFVPKIMTRWCTVPEIWCATDRQTDGLKKWHIAAVPHLEMKNKTKRKKQTKQNKKQTKKITIQFSIFKLV